MNTYKISAWIHPKNGSDDYQAELEIKVKTPEEAKIEVEKFLKKRSRITTDYKFV